MSAYKSSSLKVFTIKWHSQFNSRPNLATLVNGGEHLSTSVTSYYISTWMAAVHFYIP